MSSSGPFEVVDSAPFARTLKALRKQYYSSEEASARLGEAIGSLVAMLEVNPCRNPPTCHREPWPGKLRIPGVELWKASLRLPGLTGAAGQGRVMYGVERDSLRRVVLCMIYTHQKYGKRPPDKELMSVLSGALDS